MGRADRNRHAFRGCCDVHDFSANGRHPRHHRKLCGRARLHRERLSSSEPGRQYRSRQYQAAPAPGAGHSDGLADLGAGDLQRGRQRHQEGFSGGGTFVTPSAGGVRFNFAADPDASAVATSRRATDPFEQRQWFLCVDRPRLCQPGLGAVPRRRRIQCARLCRSGQGTAASRRGAEGVARLGGNTAKHAACFARRVKRAAQKYSAFRNREFMK